MRGFSENIIKGILHSIDDHILYDLTKLNYSVSPSDVVVVAHVHCLPSLEILIDSLQNIIGIKKRNIFIIPKPYSSIPSTVQNLMEKGFYVNRTNRYFKPGDYDHSMEEVLKVACEAAFRTIKSTGARKSRPRVILIDDGGFLTQWWDRLFGEDNIDVFSIQQTTSGVFRPPNQGRIAKIDVARCAAKRHFESAIIAKGVTRKVETVKILDPSKKIGVCGYGSIGKALASSLSDKGYSVSIYDKDPSYKNCKGSRLKLADSKFHLLRKSDVVFGTTGRNWLDEQTIERVRSPKIFISCSSRSVEFLTLIQNYWYDLENSKDPYGIIFAFKNVGHKILNGGFPINFDRKKEWEKGEEIALTRGLTFAAILQVMSMSNELKPRSSIKFFPILQKYVCDQWMLHAHLDTEHFGISENEFESLDWWDRESGGYDYFETVR